MPTVEKTHGNRVLIRGVGHFERGDQADVDEEMAAYLTEKRDDFKLVNGDGGENFEINGWLENDYEDRADAVLEGGLDDYLEEIEDAETSGTVIDAVQERRDELED